MASARELRTASISKRKFFANFVEFSSSSRSRRKNFVYFIRNARNQAVSEK